MSVDIERVLIGVGSNLGDRRIYLERAWTLLEKLPQTRFMKGSSVIETDPVGGPPQGKFLNAVWEIETTLAARELRDRLIAIETELGRRRTVPNAPREIDLDILFYGDHMIQETDLEIPHPRLHQRGFVLGPLLEIAPEKVHPKLKKSMRELWRGFREGNQ